jgi:hypothetical protein
LCLADGNSLEDSLSAITSIVEIVSMDGMREGDDGVISALKFSVSPNFLRVLMLIESLLFHLHSYSLAYAKPIFVKLKKLS